MSGADFPLAFVATATSLDTPALVFGLLLVLGALASGLARRSFVTLTALFVVVGFALGKGGAGVLEFDARSPFVATLAAVALIVILFRDGLEVEEEMLQKAWHLPFRKLVLAMPLTAALVACVTKALTDLDWTQAFLVGALLSPTDPVLSTSVVTNMRVPRLVRHSLNLESGLNDGLALPAVLALAMALSPDGDGFVWWTFVLQDLSIGFATGLAIGYLGARLLPRGRALDRQISADQKALLALGIAFAAYGAAVLTPHGNGFIAVFVAAIVLGIRRPDVRECFEARSKELLEIVKLGIFVVFGSLLTLDGLFADGAAAVTVAVFTLLAARPAAVFVALAGTKVETYTKAFMAWFGPKGVATMAFSLLVLSEGVTGAERVFNLAALTVFLSILVHGATDTAGSDWIARKHERADLRGTAASA